MATTETPTASGAWKLVYSATGNATLSLSAKRSNKEVVNHNSSSTPPGSAIEGGHDVIVGKPPLVMSLKAGDHIWGRITPNTGGGDADQFEGFVSTVQT